jgi:hypothetical protein
MSLWEFLAVMDGLREFHDGKPSRKDTDPEALAKRFKFLSEGTE